MQAKVFRDDVSYNLLLSSSWKIIYFLEEPGWVVLAQSVSQRLPGAAVSLKASLRLEDPSCGWWAPDVKLVSLHMDLAMSLRECPYNMWLSSPEQ